MNNSIRTHCDKCLSTINDGKCSCGVWIDKREIPYPISAIEDAGNYLKATDSLPMSGDNIEGGWCVVFFEGNYEDSQKVRKFIDERI